MYVLDLSLACASHSKKKKTFYLFCSKCNLAGASKQSPYHITEKPRQQLLLIPSVHFLSMLRLYINPLSSVLGALIVVLI
jgi:hypothetical protein